MRLSPKPDSLRKQDDSAEQDKQTEHNPLFKSENLQEAGEPGIVGQESFGDGKNLGEKRKRDELKADDDGHARDHERANIEFDAADLKIAQRESRGKNNSQQREKNSWK